MNNGNTSAEMFQLPSEMQKKWRISAKIFAKPSGVDANK